MKRKSVVVAECGCCGEKMSVYTEKYREIVRKYGYFMCEECERNP